MTSLAERTVLVTGANRGMGREYVAQLLGRKVARSMPLPATRGQSTLAIRA